MSSVARNAAARYDGIDADTLAERLGLPRVVAFDEIGSTLDEAHAQGAAGAPAGTLVLADAQTAGRGRQGRRWSSAAGAGIWLTLVERPRDVRSLSVLSLRCGLYLAGALDPLATGRVGVKWPNDLYVGGLKLGGLLVETRWRGPAPDWVAVGFGLNVRSPDVETGTGLSAGVSRLAALEVVVPALRRAAAACGELSGVELDEWRARDVARDRTVTAPAAGQGAGITGAGELLIRAPDGTLTAHRSGSLIFAAPLACS